MRHLGFFTLAMITGLLFYSCDPCDNLDCLSDNYQGQFRIISASNGEDLVFGPKKIYDKHQIKFYALHGEDTTFFESGSIRFPGNDYDSILYILFYPKTDLAYIQLSNGDVDTLNISYNTFQTKCCGTITQITNFRLNNLIDIPGDKGTQAIIK